MAATISQTSTKNDTCSQVGMNNGSTKPLNADKKIYEKDYKIETEDDIWKGQVNTEWKRLKFLSVKKLTHTDIAYLLRELKPDIRSATIVFKVKKETTIYTYGCGIWTRQPDPHTIMNRHINTTRQHIDDWLIKPYQKLIDTYPMEFNIKDADERNLKKEKDKLIAQQKVYVDLNTKLGNTPDKANVIKEIINIAIVEARDMEYSEEMFDQKPCYIGFTDGVYACNQKTLLPSEESRELFITRTVGYSYKEVIEVSVDAYNAAMKFISQVIPDPIVRKWVFQRYYKSVQKIVEKIFLIFYNKIGDNGKTALLKLMGKVFGGLYVKCNNNLLKKTTTSSKSGANEELVSTKGKSLVVLSEMEGIMDTALARELVGGDEISTRGNYQDKTTFESYALINIGCNSLPTPDSIDEAVFSKFRCVPFEAQFVSKDKVNEESFKFLKDENVSKHFMEWRPAVMKYMMSLADEELELPEKVMEHTKKYQSNNDVLLEFVNENIESKTDAILPFSAVWSRWKQWVREEQNNAHFKKSELKEGLQRYFDVGTWTKDTERDGIRYKQVWFGYTLTDDIDY